MPTAQVTDPHCRRVRVARAGSCRARMLFLTGAFALVSLIFNSIMEFIY